MRENKAWTGSNGDFIGKLEALLTRTVIRPLMEKQGYRPLSNRVFKQTRGCWDEYVQRRSLFTRVEHRTSNSQNLINNMQFHNHLMQRTNTQQGTKATTEVDCEQGRLGKGKPNQCALAQL
jgi:hypothetical protein